MGSRTGSPVYLGLTWDRSAWERAPSLVDAVLPLLEGVAVHWNFPAFPARQERSASGIASVLGSRLHGGGDVVVPMGYAGAPHPFLTLEELEKELGWGLRNPWSTGVTDVLGVTPSLLLPRLADLHRREALELYGRAGFRGVGVWRRGGTGPISHEGLTVFPCTRLAPPHRGAPQVASTLSQVLRRSPGAFLVLDLAAFPSPPSAAEALKALLSGISALGTGIGVLDGAPRAGGPDSSPAVDWQDWHCFPAPLLRRLLRSADVHRARRRRRSDEHQRVLEALSGNPPGTTAEEAVEAREKRPIAHMQGEVTLAGKEFDVRILGGRFCGITRGRTALTPALPASSFLVVSGRSVAFKGRSSISFEAEGVTGLREELGLDGPSGGRLVIEYQFSGDSPELLVSGAIRYPTPAAEAPLTESAPLVLALAEVPGTAPAEVSAVCPDGTRAVYRVGEGPRWLAVPGMQWTVPGPVCGVRLRTPPGAEKRWGLCFFRLRTRGRRTVLEANPFGSPAPAAGALEGEEAFSVLVSLPADGETV
jgi:hypothetical protein